SSTTDLTALALVFPLDDGAVAVVPRFWVPRDNVEDRVRRDKVPYDVWGERGLVTLTDGNVVDQDAVKLALIEARERYDVVEVPHDPWNASKLATELDGLGFPMVQFRQGFVTMSPAMKEATRLIKARKVVHGGHPVLRWCFMNVAVTEDPA